ncbi:MAG: anthranilate synthase component I family protein [Bacteroidia bacterium]|nr:anthranilate synthase component I family protein [Bacteroidia bacterium]
MKLLSLLRWADKYPYFYFHLQNNPQDEIGIYRWVLGIGRKPAKPPFHPKRWYIGGWTYEWKAYYKRPYIEFPREAFFVPQYVFATEEAPEWESEPSPHEPVRKIQLLQSSFQREGFIQIVDKLREHIHQGEVYQVNLSLALLWEATIDPISTFYYLLKASPATFNFIFKFQQKYVIGASPERFFWQWQKYIAQQPIKGTIRRGSTWQEDVEAVTALLANPKELAENTMIVDLVRNDLNTVCVPGSVYVPRWAEVQTFPGLHHLVSTVCGEKRPEVPWWEAAENLFPPGSMTGAPKRAAMQYIRRYEPVGRGFYAGAIGYISADGEADFAVVIRSYVYDKLSRQLVLQVGSGITYDSDPVAEWEESWLKAEKLLEALQLPARVLKS